jgi:hypothetical protein
MLPYAAVCTLADMASFISTIGGRCDRCCSIYLLYSYKSTNTDARGAGAGEMPKFVSARKHEAYANVC